MIIVLQQKEHETYTRRGDDLYCTYNVGITEALCGFEFTLKQLDGRDLVIKHPRGKVIEPGQLNGLNKHSLNIIKIFLICRQPTKN